MHFWEEPCISGKNGSGTVFFSGCTLDCAFCQNYDISHGGFGKQISCQRLADIFKELEEKGAHNINLVTPTHFVPAIIRALDIYKPKIPVVYNSGGYDSAEEIRALNGYVDIFLMDLKYLSNFLIHLEIV
ncbi:MAG: radical SAM protein, partial [Acutalibacteraceae bacterium]